MNNEPVAYINKDDGLVCAKCFNPLYTHPAKYCPSENNAAYEKGFIDGMVKMTESAVHRAVEGMSEKTLTDEEILLEAYYILMREQQRKAQEK